jgi:hypothetical protein
MGYSEVPCRICGVSFNISRIRKRGEPQTDAIRNTGDGSYPGFVDAEQSDCAASDGCLLQKRIMDMREWLTPGPAAMAADTEALAKEDGDDEEDEEYILESSDDEEEYEYESDEDLVLADQHDGDDDMDDDSPEEYQEDWREFLTGKTANDNVRDADTYLPIDYLGNREGSDEEIVPRKCIQLINFLIRLYLLTSF